MKRELRHHREVLIPGPRSPQTQERQMSESLDAMIALMGDRFKNGVLKELNQGTVAKFADSTVAAEIVLQLADRKKKKPQVGNFANVYMDLVNPLLRRLSRQFDDDRIAGMVSTIIQRANQSNQRQLHDLIEQRMGIDTATLAADEGLTFTINALERETIEQVKRLRDDTLTFFTTNTLRDMALGHSLGDLMEQFDGMVEKRKGQARMVARTQISSFNSLTTKIRAQNLGIEEAVWDGVDDARERPSHRDRNGKRFKLSDGCYSSVDRKYLLPGVDYHCRCTYKLIVPEA